MILNFFKKEVVLFKDFRNFKVLFKNEVNTIIFLKIVNILNEETKVVEVNEKIENFKNVFQAV